MGYEMLFAFLKRVFASVEFQKQWCSFVPEDLYLDIATVFCRLSLRMARMYMD